MEIRSSTIAVVAASCITVGAAGAFLASRSSHAPQPAAAQSSGVADPSPPSATEGVEQSEAVVSDTPAAPATQNASPSPSQAPAASTPHAANSRAARPPPRVGPGASPAAARPEAARPEPARSETARPAGAPKPQEPSF